VAVAAGVLIWQFSPEEEIPSPPPVVSPTPTSTPSSTPSPTSPPITPEPYIKVISPNGGEIWEIGETYQIKWNCPDDAGADVIDIFMEDKRESVEKPIGSLIECSLGKYSWKVENISSGQDSFKVQLRHVAGAQPIIDESDNYFSIVVPDESDTISSLTSIDETWNLYTNNKYGFSIKVPKKMFHGYGSMCEWKTDSYRPNGGIVPVKIFEDENIYISSEYFYELTGGIVRNNIHYFSGCDKVINSLSYLKNDKYFQQQSWEFVIKNISDDIELENFIKERYGSGCKLGNKNYSDQSGVFNISIQGDGKDLEETKCPLNYITVLKYYPAKDKAVSWHLGQAFTFIAGESPQNDYDQEMVDSFKFK